eukprot:TRINITY_DN3213_c1_g2_i1.p1 TRINITY_DN3213_c1_g2~~TRINITY_DN3213_c1_g2_i1.p1  ORF type:complete len:344 (+),score=67.33 TRINITY_DN3213_c1_g2_i1:60-1034(+)
MAGLCGSVAAPPLVAAAARRTGAAAFGRAASLRRAAAGAGWAGAIRSVLCRGSNRPNRCLRTSARGMANGASLFGSRHGSRRVAVYGGAFDPITNAHLTCCSEIIHSESADEVWICPSGDRPDKPMLRPAIDRVIMCEIAVNTTFSTEFPVKVWSGEAFAPEQVYTYDMLSALQAQHPDTSFVFVIGSDWLQAAADLRKWRSRDPSDSSKTVVTGDRLVSEFDFLVVRRPGYDVQDLSAFGPRFRWLQHVGPLQHVQGNLSSTEIRKRARIDLCAIDGLVPVGVMGYIKRHGLYHKPGVLEVSMWESACRNQTKATACPPLSAA